jgi:hypothetical protein
MKLTLDIDTLRVESFETVAAIAAVAEIEDLWSYPRVCTTKFQGCPLIG